KPTMERALALSLVGPARKRELELSTPFPSTTLPALTHFGLIGESLFEPFFSGAHTANSVLVDCLSVRTKFQWELDQNKEQDHKQDRVRKLYQRMKQKMESQFFSLELSLASLVGSWGDLGANKEVETWIQERRFESREYKKLWEQVRLGLLIAIFQLVVVGQIGMGPNENQRRKTNLHSSRFQSGEEFRKERFSMMNGKRGAMQTPIRQQWTSKLITGLVGPDLYLSTNSSLVDLPFLPLKLILMATGAEITANKNTTMIGLTEDLYYYANGLELELPANRLTILLFIRKLYACIL
ncbi:hypothetical protein BHE74_00008347, partial [Ensete ventricosum]